MKVKEVKSPDQSPERGQERRKERFQKEDATQREVKSWKRRAGVTDWGHQNVQKRTK